MLNLLLIALLNIQLSAAKSFNFSLKIVHRDSPESPLYPGNLTSVERIQRYIGFSEARASYLTASISRRNNNSAMHPSAKASTEVWLDSSVYLVKIGIGEPVTEYWLALDTGSDLTWIQCKPCAECYDQVDPIFDPRSSSSFRPVSCTKEISCHPYICENRRCLYGISYADGSESLGYIAREFFVFTTPSPPFSFRMKFGCSNTAKGHFAGKISGILGMDLEPISLMGQLGKYYFSNKFSYCLVHPNAVTNSYLKFGDGVYNGRPVQEFKKTPFLANPFNNHYYLDLQDISINGKRLNLPKDTFKIKGNGHGGCIIDSGTTITRLKSSVYIRVKDELVAYFARYGIHVAPGGCGAVLCFELPRSFNAFPSMTYHFSGGDLYVEPENCFLYSVSHFAPAIAEGDAELTILGSWHQHNIRFIYDTGLRELSFAPEECDKDSP
ncbi:hypothetical protein Dsin_022422 [Dipteronia sinensis]|uniref:Peptidase A1 domain-containing protein n=1 Tax=Dipteronia sinensis TaxID=43782 RepID=A0AAE0A2C0_9ROSI|nr:hypothetical protein Dsin_022422 [Dipteronia sinensis]